MISKEALLESMLHEIKVSQHLATKIPVGGLSYKPTPAQRDTLETMKFLSLCATGIVHYVLEGNWDWWQKRSEETSFTDADQFIKAMDITSQELTQLVNGISHEDFTHKEVEMPWGVSVTIGRAIMDCALKWLVGYRMQLFLYAKAAGASEIGTKDCWHGIDEPKAKQAS